MSPRWILAIAACWNCAGFQARTYFSCASALRGTIAYCGAAL